MGFMSGRQARRGSAMILERIDTDDWDEFVQGDLTADELRERAFGGGR